MSHEHDNSIIAVLDAVRGAEQALRDIDAATSLGMFDKAARLLEAFKQDDGGRMTQLHAAAEICRSLAMQKRNSDARGEKTRAFRTLEGRK